MREGDVIAANNAPLSDRQIQKQNSCITQALGAAGMAGAADFVGLPANVGQNLGPSFPGMSPNGSGGVEVTAGDVALLVKDPAVERALVGTAIKVLPTVASTFVTKAIPVVGWGLAIYQAGHATIAGIQQYKKTFDSCMAKP